MLEKKISLVLLVVSAGMVFSAWWTQAQSLVQGAGVMVFAVALVLLIIINKSKDTESIQQPDKGLSERMQKSTLSLVQAFQFQLVVVNTDLTQVRSLLSGAIVELQTSFNGLNSTT